MLKRETHMMQDIEMARIGRFGSFDVVVYTDDQDIIPHFHVLSNPHGSFDCSIGNQSAEYSQLHCQSGQMTNTNWTELVTFMSMSKKGILRNLTNREYTLMLWNDNNPNFEIDEDQAMPEYIQMTKER